MDALVTRSFAVHHTEGDGDPIIVLELTVGPAAHMVHRFALTPADADVLIAELQFAAIVAD